MSILIAMTIHAIATYGESLSPAEDSQYSTWPFIGYKVLTYPSRHPEQTEETTDNAIGKPR